MHLLDESDLAFYPKNALSIFLFTHRTIPMIQNFSRDFPTQHSVAFQMHLTFAAYLLIFSFPSLPWGFDLILVLQQGAYLPTECDDGATEDAQDSDSGQHASFLSAKHPEMSRTQLALPGGSHPLHSIQ